MGVIASHIHPFRFRRTRPFAREVGRKADEMSAIGPTMRDLQMITGLLFAAYNTAISKVPVEFRPLNATTIASDETSLAGHFACWVKAGRNTFLLTPPLVEMLQHTNLDGVRLADIELPFKTFYLGFGDAYPGKLPGPPNRIDGAYIEEYGGVISITLTSRRLDVSNESSASWPFNRDRYGFVILDLKDKSRSLTEALDDWVAAYTARETGDDDALDAAAAMFAEQGIRLERPKVRACDEASAYMTEARAEIAAALGLVANALCYLGAEPELSGPELPDDAPPAQAQAFMAGSGSAHKTAKAQLLDRGISVVRWLGPRVPHSKNLNAHGATKAAHWRSGHWRRQAYGPGWSLRRLKWIAPVMVGNETPSPSRDRVYLVDVTHQPTAK